MRRVLSLFLSALLLLLTAPVGQPAQAATTRQPILFVHGLSGGSFNWAQMIYRFKADGYTDAELFNWSYNWAQDNTVTARGVAAKVEQIKAQTGWAKVDIVTHSMGALSTRHYLKELGGTASVDAFVSLGGPNHGTTTAYACALRSCADMRFDSPFLTRLNAGDETPGAVRYGTWWSWCDAVISPSSSTPLAGARNTYAGCVGHISLLGHRPTYTGVRDFVGAA